MGLFGFGKNEKTVKMSDFFSAEDLATIKEKAQAARSRGSMADLLGKGLIDYIGDPEKEISCGRFNKFIKVADSFVKSFDPSLESIIQKGIEKFRLATGK